MKYLKQEKKKSKLPLIIGILLICLAAAGAGAWFFFGSQAQNNTQSGQVESVKIRTPYGNILLEEDWVPYLHYELTEGDVTVLAFSARIGESNVKLFDLQFGTEENLAGYLTADSGEQVPVGVVVHDIVFEEGWSQEEEELVIAMQDALNEVLTQLGVEIVLPEIPEETEEVGTEVTVETGFGVLAYMDFWNGGLRITEEEGWIGGFGTVPGKEEQKLFEISVGGDGDISAGMYTDENGQKIPVFFTVPELTLDADWTEEEQSTLYAMQNVLNDILEQLDLTPVEQAEEAVPEDVAVTTTYGTLTYPGQYKGKLRIAQDTSSGYRIRAYATMPGKTEVHLFDIVIGAAGDVYVGILTDPYGNRKGVYLNVPALSLNDSWSEEERREVAYMQDLLNDFCDQLSVSYEEKPETDSTADGGDVMIWTAYGTLQYPGEYRQELVTEIAGENGNTVRFYAVRNNGERVKLFDLIFGGSGNAYVGRYTTKDGTECEVYITPEGITPGDNWSDEELEIIYSMQEAVNYVLDKMEESGMLVY